MGNKHGNQAFLGRLQQWLEYLTGCDLFARFVAKTDKLHRGGQNAFAA